MTGLQEGFDKNFKDKRFQVKEYPNVISTGYFYVVTDNKERMNDISFKSDWTEAEEFCIFLNNLYDNYYKFIEYTDKFRDLANSFADFCNKYEKSSKILINKYKDVDQSKYEVLLELDRLINEE